MSAFLPTRRAARTLVAVLVCWSVSPGAQTGDNTFTGATVVLSDPLFSSDPFLEILGAARPVTVTFTNVATAGITSLQSRVDLSPPPPNEWQAGAPPIYYDIQTTAVLKGAVLVCFDTHGMSLPSDAIRMHRLDGTSWVALPERRMTPGVEICADSPGLGTFAIFYPQVPETIVRRVAGLPGPDPADDISDGGVAAMTAISQPYAIALDPARLFAYVGSLEGVQRLDLSNGNITTVVPPSTSILPWGLAVDSAENLYYARHVGGGRFDEVVIRYDTSSNTETVIAGGGDCCGIRPGELATSSYLTGIQALLSDGNGGLYFTALNHTYRIDAGGILRHVFAELGGPVTTGALSAPFWDWPYGLALDANGHLLVGGQYLVRISPEVRVAADPTGAIVDGSPGETFTVVAGVSWDTALQNPSPYAGDGLLASQALIYVIPGMFVARDGAVIFSGQGGVRRIDPGDDNIVNGGPGETIQTIAGFSGYGAGIGVRHLSTERYGGYAGLVEDPINGGVIVADYLSNQVLRFGIPPKFLGTNRPPVANAGPDQTTDNPEGMLDGSASSDPDGDALSFSWTEGTTALGAGEQPQIPLGVGAHTITLTVTDTSGATSKDTVVIDVLGADLALTAASSASQVHAGDLITYTLTLINNGPIGVDLARLNIAISPALELVSANAAGCTLFTSMVGCDFESIAAGQTVSLTIIVRALLGSFTTTFMLSAPTADPDRTNNSVSLSGSSDLFVSEIIHVSDNNPAPRPSLILPTIVETITVSDTPAIPDTVAPVVTAPASITIAATGAAGARASFPSPQSSVLQTFLTGGSATDDRGAAPTRLTPQALINNVVVEATNDTLFPVNQTTVVTFRFRDAAGNTGSASATVTVTPALSMVEFGGVAVPATTSQGAPTPVTVMFAGVFARGVLTADIMPNPPQAPAEFTLVSPVFNVVTTASVIPPILVCIHAPGRLLHYENGTWVDVTTPAASSMTRTCGQVTTLSPFVVAIPHYAFSGFLPPVAARPAINAVNAGRTVPVKWRLMREDGSYISDVTTFLSLMSAPIACDTAPSNVVEAQLESVDDATARYDATENQFIFNWKTSSTWRGCRMLELKLDDRSVHYAKFQFR